MSNHFFQVEITKQYQIYIFKIYIVIHKKDLNIIIFECKLINIIPINVRKTGMSHIIVPMTLEYYDRIIDLWRNSAGLCLSDSDSRENLGLYLDRNKGFSFLALTADGKRVIGTVQAGHDQRSGYIYHVAVHPDFQKQGIATELVKASEKALNAAGIIYIHAFVITNNKNAVEFWKKAGWDMRNDLVAFCRCPSSPARSKK